MRRDVYVYNEATGFVVTSRGLAGYDLSEIEAGSKEWRGAVAEGVFLPISLVQDDPVRIRVVVEEELTPQEAEEWVDVVSAPLSLPDGVLTLTGGMEYLWGEEMEEYTRYLELPPGDYRADVCTYLPGINGEYCLQTAGPSEPIGAYFRRTRPGEDFPPWLWNFCAETPGTDHPDHEHEWEDARVDYEADEPSYVDFLLRLSRSPAPPTPTLEQGWFPVAAAPRKPIRCPTGITFQEG